MKYVVQVVAIFATNSVGTRRYDVWENAFFLGAEGPRGAIDNAMRISKSVLNESTNWSALGYAEQPVLFAVRSVHTAADLTVGMESYARDSMILTKITTLNEGDFEAIKSLESVSIRYQVMYID